MLCTRKGNLLWDVNRRQHEYIDGKEIKVKKKFDNLAYL